MMSNAFDVNVERKVQHGHYRTGADPVSQGYHS